MKGKNEASGAKRNSERKERNKERRDEWKELMESMSGVHPLPLSLWSERAAHQAAQGQRGKPKTHLIFSFFVKKKSRWVCGVGGLSFLFVGYGPARWPMLRKEGRQAQPSTHPFHLSLIHSSSLLLFLFNSWNGASGNHSIE